MEGLRHLGDLTNLRVGEAWREARPAGGGMGPKHKVLQGTAGKRSPKKRARKRVVEDEDSDDEVLGKGRLPARGQRESRNKFPIGTKIQAISRMAEGKMVSSVSEEMGLPVGVVSQWWLQRDDIRNAYEREVLRSSGQDEVEEHIRRSQENFDRKRMEKFLNSHPERQGAAWQADKRARVEASPPSEPDEDFAAEEFMRKRRKESSPSSEEDAGSWSMSFVDNTPVKAKKVARNKIKDMPAVPKLKIKELPPLVKSARKESPKKGSGSSGKVMNQIKRIKKDQKEMKAKPEVSQVKTSTYEVREPPSPPAASSLHSISSIIGASSHPSPRPSSSHPSPRPSSSHSTPRTNHSPMVSTHAAAWAATSPSPSPERVAAPSSLIVQSPPQPPRPALPKSRSRSPVKDPEAKALPPIPIKQEAASPLKTAESPPKLRLKSPRKSRSPAKAVKTEPVEEYVEAREDGGGSIMSDDGGHLTGFLEKVEKPDEKTMVDRYYSPFGLTGEQGVRAKQGIKRERPSPMKGGGVPEERGEGAVSPPRSDIMSSVPHSLADAYPHLKYIPAPQPAPVVQQVQRFQPLNLSSNQRRGSAASVEELPLNLQTLRRSSLPPARSRSNSIEEIGKFIPSGSPGPRHFAPGPARGAVRARGRARAVQSPLAVTHSVRPALAHPQVRAPMVRGVMPPGIRGAMRARGARMMSRGRAGVVATRPGVPMVAARGRPVVRGLARGGVMRGRGGMVIQQPLVAQPAPARGRGLVRPPPPARGRGMVAPQTVRGRPPGPRPLAPQTRLISPGPRGVAPQYRAQQPMGYRAPQAPQPRYHQPSPAPRFPLQPRGPPARGVVPMARGAGAQVRGAMRGGPMAGGPMARGQPAPRGRGHPAQGHPALGRPGEAKRKVTVELSDRQLAALQSLGIM